MILEDRQIETEAMLAQDGHQFVTAAVEILAGTLVGVFAQASATAEAEHLSHQVWGTLYNYAHAASMHFWLPDEKKMDWLSEKYPNTFDKYYRPRYEMWAQMAKEGKRFQNGGLPQLCQVCQVPMLFTEVSKDDPMQISYRSSEFNGEKFHTCSDGCKDIFDHEPEKYVHAWMPVHQIFQGNCGGAAIPDILNWYHFKPEDGGDYAGSADETRWKAMHGETTGAASSDTESAEEKAAA